MREGLKASDLLTAFVERQVLPLQARPHLISDMSGCRDPCRMSTRVLPDTEMVRLVNFCWKYALEAIIKVLLLYLFVHDNSLLFML